MWEVPCVLALDTLDVTPVFILVPTDTPLPFIPVLLPVPIWIPSVVVLVSESFIPSLMPSVLFFLSQHPCKKVYILS